MPNEEKEICNWTYQEGGLYKADCIEDYMDDDFMDWLCIRHFKYCPYCGKKINIIDEDDI